MTELARTGRKPLPAGTRVRDQHTVAVKLPDAERDKLAEIAKILGMREGRWATNHVIDLIRSIDLDQLRTQHSQESFSFAEAG